uniref:Mercaptopyruvate sulfurtransferase n=1 Tax=Fundulus heteroclitus TaxID=8078 RepID=A0A3Q2SWR7_FUNHE
LSIMAAPTPAVVSAQWLAEAVENKLVGPKLRILDGSWYLAKTKRVAREEFSQKHIPGASDFGSYSAPRLWWMFRVFGLGSVSVLDGGLKNWLAEGHPVTSDYSEPERRDFQASLNQSWVKSFEDVLENIKTKQVQVVDSRSAGRFRGTEPEPREDVLPGHFPATINMPFTSFLDSSGKHLGTETLAKLFKEAGVDLEKPLWASCGFGVTACHVILASYRLGYSGIGLYDGSWGEFFKRAPPEYIISEAEGKKE